ncbi:hypothetical protein [Sphingobium estronivorans]|uniref:hypothetical protein n=1 Tax=Sphingobium estronivorans TaxID=1577690 RepID=UPI0013C30A0F|nr:hypothetical protein [Sphingobium estronivorans]
MQTSQSAVFPPSAALERLFDRVELIRGRGDRRSNRLCIMTFVALLAGEGHTDDPRTASPFIRNFAVRLNDCLPDAQRQQLKFFAPRIVATRDDSDNLRAETVRSSFAQEILPQLKCDHAHEWLPESALARIKSFAAQPFALASTASPALLERLRLQANKSEFNAVARAAADLLVVCAQSAPPEKEAWYWGKAIELLDRLCDIGAKPTGVAISEQALQQAERRLEGRRLRATGFSRVLGLWFDLIEWFSDQPAQRVSAVEAQYRVMTSPSDRGGDWDEVWTITPVVTPAPVASASKPGAASPQKSKTTST